MFSFRRTSKSEQDEPVEEFVTRLRTSGRIYPGSFGKAEYIKDHRKEIDKHLNSLRKSDSSEADLLRQLIDLNSKVRTSREGLSERVEARAIHALSSLGRYGSKQIITTYDARLRKRTDRLILPIVTLIVGLAAGYLVYECNNAVKKMLEPCAQRLYQLYDDIDHRR